MEMTEKQLQTVIEQAKNVAEAAHRGATRNDGKTPYFTHVEAVADAVEPRLKPIALLHDVVEDSDITIEDLKNAGFPPYVLEAVELLTHRNNEPNVSYWAKIAKNKDATAVKIADMKNNLSDSPGDRQREKYMKGLALIAKAGYDIADKT